MSRIHDAVRRLEHKSAPETGSGAALNSLVGALIGELASEVPDDPYLETVRADLQAASRAYETSKKKDLALRFYLAIRSLLHEHAFLQERLRKAEFARMNQTPEFANVDPAEVRPEVHPLGPMADPNSERAAAAAAASSSYAPAPHFDQFQQPESR